MLRVASIGVAKADNARASKMATFNFKILTSFYFTSKQVWIYTKLQQSNQVCFQGNIFYA